MQQKIAFLLGAVLLAVTGCTSVPLTSIPRAMALNPMEASFTDIGFAVRLPDTFELPDDGVVVSIEVASSDKSEQIAHELTLVPLDGPLAASLKKKSKRGFVIHQFGFDDALAAELDAVRAEMMKIKERHPGGGNTLSFRAQAFACLKPGANPFRKFELTFFIRNKPEESFYTLIRETELPLDETTRSGVRECAPSD